MSRKLQRQQLVYLYDLPKNFGRGGDFGEGFGAGVTATEIARLIYDTTGILIEKMPIINYYRDMFKPFYSACVSFEGALYDHNKALSADIRCRSFEELRERFKYFVIKGKECRALVFDDQILGDKREETNQKQNIFMFGLDKTLSHHELDQQLSQKVPESKIKSLKISRDEKYKSKGYGFVCWESQDDARKALATLGSNAIPWNPTNMKDAEKKAKNNIYVKNIPDDWNEASLRKAFEKFGHISSLVLNNTPTGKFAFICYTDPNGKDHTYGPTASSKAVEAMHGHKLGDKELYVAFAQSQIQRKIEVQKQIINLKQSKKRCNLLVRGFPDSWKDETDFRRVFEAYGKVENVKVLSTGANVPYQAFVCYEEPSQASEAKLNLNGKQFDGKTLEIKPYEIKELKDIQNLIARDRSDFEKFLEQMKGVNVNYSDITNTPGMTQILQQVLQLAHQSMQQQSMVNQQQRGQFTNR